MYLETEDLLKRLGDHHTVLLQEKEEELRSLKLELQKARYELQEKGLLMQQHATNDIQLRELRAQISRLQSAIKAKIALIQQYKGIVAPPPCK